jgi:hypothetical protein
VGLGSEVQGYPLYPTEVEPVGLPSFGQFPSTWTVNSSVDTGPADASA